MQDQQLQQKLLQRKQQQEQWQQRQLQQEQWLRQHPQASRDDGTLSPEQLGKAVDLRRRYFEAPAERRSPVVLHDLKKWADGAPIYWIAPETLEPTLPAEHVAYIPMTPPVDLQSLDEIGLYKDFGDTTEPRFGLAAERLAVYRMETTTAPPERTSADRGK